MTELVTVEMRDDVALLVMDDGKANALSHAMLDALNGALDQAEKNAKAVVLIGRPGRFSAGFDLQTMMSGIDAATKLVSAGADLYMRMYQLPLPLVAACTGHALAGGALLLLVCDTRVGADGAFKIGLNEVAISLPLPILAQELARDRLEKRALTAATIQAKIYTPPEAAAVGYLDSIAVPDAVVEQAFTIAKQLSGLSQKAYALTKVTLRETTVKRIKETLAGDLAKLTPQT